MGGLDLRTGLRIKRYQSTLAMVTLLALGACDLQNKKIVNLSNPFIDQSAAYANNSLAADPTGTIVDHGTFKTVRAVSGDTFASLAQRAGVSADALARHNGLTVAATPLIGKDYVIPPVGASSNIIDVVDPNAPTVDSIQVASLGDTPAGITARHRVEPGQTAFSIAQLYGVSVAKLGEWNGLGADLAVSPGQELIIPPRADSGLVSAGNVQTASTEPPTTPIVTTQTPVAPSGGFQVPVAGSVRTGFNPSADQDGYIYSTANRAPVKAAGAGKVVLISESTGPQGTIVMLQHPNGLISVYGRMGEVNVAKGAEVSGGQAIGTTADNELMFQFRRGTTAVDPAQYL